MKCSNRSVRSWFLIASSTALVLSMSACKTQPKVTNVGVLGSRDLVPPPYARPVAVDTSRPSSPAVAHQGLPPSAPSQVSSEPILPGVESFVPAESPVFISSEAVPQPEDVLSTPAPAAAATKSPTTVTASVVTPVIVPVTENLRQYKVQKGDTLSGIAQCVGVKWQDIAALNPSVDPNRMKIGETLYLPSYALDKPIVMPKSSKATATRSGTPASSSAVKASSIPNDGVYTVVAGDSLWTISRRFRVGSDDIRSWNNLKTDKLSIGQKLKLKGSAVVVDSAPKRTVKPAETDAAAKLPETETIKSPATEVIIEETIVNTADAIPTETVAARAIDHLISDNDTLESIAMLYEVKLEDLLRSNPNIKSNADLVPNTTIKISYPAK